MIDSWRNSFLRNIVSSIGVLMWVTGIGLVHILYRVLHHQIRRTRLHSTSGCLIGRISTAKAFRGQHEDFKRRFYV
jgi:hypothetical protein